MKDYRRPVDYHNKDYRKVSYGRFPGHPPTAPVYNPHATWVNCNKSQTWEEGDLLASISGRAEDEVDEAIPLSMMRPNICHYLLSVNVILLHTKQHL